MYRQLLIWLWGFFFVGCSNQTVEPEIENLGRAAAPPQTSAHTDRIAPLEEIPESETTVHEGTVLETIEVPNYTYIKLKTEGDKEIWTAVPKSKVIVGTSVGIKESMVQKNWKSPSMGRAFDEVIFGVLLEGGKEVDAGTKMDLPPGHPAI